MRLIFHRAPLLFWKTLDYTHLHYSQITSVLYLRYFEDLNVQVKSLKHLLKAKAVLCPGLTIEFVNEKKSNDKENMFKTSPSSEK